MDGAVLEAALLRVSGVREHLDHLGVGGQHLGGEAADAALAGHGADVFEERGGHSPALLVIPDEEGDLGLVGRLGRRSAEFVDAVVADGGDELTAHGRGEAHAVDIVVVGEAPHVLVGQPGVGGEEAVVLGLVRDLLVEADEPLSVVRRDGPDPGRPAVAQDDIGFPVGRVGALLGARHGVSVRRWGPRRRSGGNVSSHLGIAGYAGRHRGMMHSGHRARLT